MSTAARRLWQTLTAAGIVTGDAPPAGDTQSPWYVRAMLGIAGWIAAAFLFGFVGEAFPWVIDSKTASLAVGAMLIVAAIVLLRAWPGRDFIDQFALATSLAGQVLVGLGMFELLRPRQTMAWIAMAGAQAALIVLIPTFVHRVWSGYAMAACIALALGSSGGTPAAVGVLGAGAALLWSKEIDWVGQNSMLRPVAYGLTLGLIQVQGAALLTRDPLGLLTGTRHAGWWTQPWVGESLAGVVLVAAVARLLAGGTQPGQRNAVIAFAGAVGAALLSLHAPGLASGLMLIVLGFAGGNRVLTGLGIAALVFYLGAYYYTLQATLLAKSAVLAATGVVLLGARSGLSRWMFRSREDAHA